MCAAAFDFIAERGFIAASDDPNQLFDWMSDYDQRRRDAQADDDDDAAAHFAELRQEAEDRVVELKAARVRRAAPRPAAPATVVQRAPEPPTRREVERPTASTWASHPVDRARDDRARRREAEEAAARKAAEEAEAAAELAANEELRQLRERAANAKARREAALAATARIEVEAKRAAAGAAREQARRQAAKEVEDEERKAAEAEAAARGAATSVAKRTAGTMTTGAAAPARVVESPMPKVDVPTPLALLFQERLTEVMETPAATLPTPRPSTAPPAARAPAPAASPAPPRPVAVPPILAKVPAPPPNPVEELPALTGADLASYRTWLGVSQRALAAKLAVEQSVISKSEGKPTTVLPPQLRKALHIAMQEPRDAAKGAS